MQFVGGGGITGKIARNPAWIETELSTARIEPMIGWPIVIMEPLFKVEAPAQIVAK